MTVTTGSSGKKALLSLYFANGNFLGETLNSSSVRVKTLEVSLHNVTAKVL